MQLRVIYCHVVQSHLQSCRSESFTVMQFRVIYCHVVQSHLLSCSSEPFIVVQFRVIYCHVVQSHLLSCSSEPFIVVQFRVIYCHVVQSHLLSQTTSQTAQPGWSVHLWCTFNPLTSKSDQHLISPYRKSPKSNIKVMRIKEMIAEQKSS